MRRLLIILILLATTSCYKKEPIDVEFTFLQKIEVYSDIYLYDLIKKTNTEIISDNEKINTTKLGTKDLNLIYKYKNKKYKKNFNIEIIDTEKPFIYTSSTKTLIVDNDFDFCGKLIIGDNYDRSPKCEIIGKYDYKKTGNYKIKIEVTDQSNNKAVRNMTVKVVEKEEKPQLPTKLIEFSDIIKNNQDKNISFGIDVSSWQKEIDFEKVKESGATFVMLRLGFQGTSTKELNIDNYFKENIKKAKKAGLKVGVYLYTVSQSIKEAKNQAIWVIDVLEDEKLELPIVFDWENFSDFRKYKINLYDLNEMANVFIKTVNDYGYKGMLYSSKTYLENFWENKHDYPVWLAHYTDKSNYDGDYVMWQLTDKGKVEGINGPTDINILYNLS